MIFTELDLKGVFLVEREDVFDKRGGFGRFFCREEYAAHGLSLNFEQGGLSFNQMRGTLRGLHFQQSPYQQAKLVSCLRGRIFDCVVDLRKKSPTHLSHIAVELHEFGPILYIPGDFAHGFQTLTDMAVVQYYMSSCYTPDSGGGLRWNDPVLGIAWPECEERVISERDQRFPLLEAAT